MVQNIIILLLRCSNLIWVCWKSRRERGGGRERERGREGERERGREGEREREWSEEEKEGGKRKRRGEKFFSFAFLHINKILLFSKRKKKETKEPENKTKKREERREKIPLSLATLF